MSEFKRRLNHIDTLQSLANVEGPNWWKELLQMWRLPGEEAGRDGLRLAIRDNYLNFYRRGQSVARVGFGRGADPHASVHLKYLGIDSDDYARLTDGVFAAKGQPDIRFVTGKSLPSIVDRSEEWTGREKFMVDLVVAQTRSVLDLEIGLPKLSGEDGGAPRMDLAVLEDDPANKRVKLVFWEAKTIDDDRLRATEPEDAEVHTQLRKYVKYMGEAKHHNSATEEYRVCCQLMVQLAKMARKDALLSPLIRRVAEGGAFKIDPEPRLVIFEGATQRGRESCEVKRGKNWEKYEAEITGKWTTQFSATAGYRLA